MKDEHKPIAIAAISVVVICVLAYWIGVPSIRMSKSFHDHLELFLTVTFTAAVVYALSLGWEGSQSQSQQKMKFWPLIFFILGPPVWFWVEYNLYVLPTFGQTESEVEKYVHAQECARNIWLGVNILLGSIYFKRLHGTDE